MFKDFKEFISRGSVVDLAVAVIMGAAFTNIVQALVKDIISPILGIFLGGVDFSNLSIMVGHSAIRYGSFIQASINFLIIALVIFALMQAINKFQKHFIDLGIGERPVSQEVKELREIKDLLKNK